jgi:hypothetical protein
MGLLDNLQPPERQWPCKVRDEASKLDESDAKILFDAVMNPEWKYLTLENALKDKGITMGQNVIKAHRTKRCSCWKI